MKILPLIFFLSLIGCNSIPNEFKIDDLHIKEVKRSEDGIIIHKAKPFKEELISIGSGKLNIDLYRFLSGPDSTKVSLVYEYDEKKIVVFPEVSLLITEDSIDFDVNEDNVTFYRNSDKRIIFILDLKELAKKIESHLLEK